MTCVSFLVIYLDYAEEIMFVYFALDNGFLVILLLSGWITGNLNSNKPACLDASFVAYCSVSTTGPN